MTTSTRVNRRNLVNVISVMILVGTEVYAVAVAAGWAIAGLFELGSEIGYALMVIFALFGTWMLRGFWRQAVSIEPISERA